MPATPDSLVDAIAAGFERSHVMLPAGQTRETAEVAAHAATFWFSRRMADRLLSDPAEVETPTPT